MSFSCNVECNSNCCSFTILRSFHAIDEKIDKKYFDLHKIEFKQEIKDKVKIVYFKIPIKCKWFKNNKCVDYENRPYSCKVGHGNNKPFQIEGCTYGND
jgi:Fe-S-cluster containining protein